MPVNPGDLVQLSWRGTCFNQRVLMVRNFRVTGSGGSPQPTGQTLAQIIDAVEPGTGSQPISDAYLACLTANYTLNAIRAQVVRPDRSAFVERSYNDAGTGGAGTLSNTMGAITFRTANAGRNQVSTIKVGPLPAAFTIAGDVAAAGRAFLASLADFLQAPFVVNPPAITLSPIIWHAPGLTYDAIINYTVQPQARVMVRRTVGRGE